jgi:hypothetical protein
MATSRTWPTNGGCAYLHGNARGTGNLGGIRRSLPGSLLKKAPRPGVFAGFVFDDLG